MTRDMWGSAASSWLKTESAPKSGSRKPRARIVKTQADILSWLITASCHFMSPPVNHMSGSLLLHSFMSRGARGGQKADPGVRMTSPIPKSSVSLPCDGGRAGLLAFCTESTAPFLTLQADRACCLPSAAGSFMSTSQGA